MFKGNTTGLGATVGAVGGGIALGVVTSSLLSGVLVIHATAQAGVYTIGGISTILLKTALVSTAVVAGAAVGGITGEAIEDTIWK
jgi:hypothetical protein